MNLSEISKYKIFVDLDGVMSNLNKFVMQHTGRSFHELRSEHKFTDFVQRYRAKHGSLFDRLEKMPDADILWGYIETHRPNILTATGPLYEEGAKEKIAWVRKNLNGFGRIYTVVSGKDKYRYASPDSIIIDDTPVAINNWRQVGGIGILHTSARETINTLYKLGL